MDQFKSLASAVMYTSLVGIPIVFICPFIILIAFKLEYFQLMDLVQGGALWLVSIILIGLIKGLEARVWQVATADEETARERDHVVHVWRHKAFPDW
ncbi:MAG: hypothetical protein JXR97_15080 [Planctomycetes bacterium]|nr:hypothetical protein [Planctomycetota bacterium]